MAREAENNSGWRWSGWRLAGWSIPAILLLLPLVAMQFTEEVNWTPADFVFAAVLFGSVGLAFEFIVRRSDNFAYRSGAALAVVAAFLTIWVNGAVGMIGSEGNVFNLWFGAVLAIALIGAIVARLEAAGMVRAMVAAAIAQAAVSAIGLSTDVRGGVLSMAFAGLWLLAAWLFRKSAREQTLARAA